MSTPQVLLLMLLLSSSHGIVFVFYVGASTCNKMAPISLELIHRHAPQLMSTSAGLGPPKRKLDRIKQLIHSDNVRLQTISYRTGMRRRALVVGTGSLLELPVRSAADRGMGQYFVSFRVGSPHPQKFVLIADTGSDLTWMNCECKCNFCPLFNPHPGRIFHADDSATFKTIPCSADFCKADLADYFSLAKCPSPEAPCLFDYRYVDGSKVIGVFANETVTVGLNNRRKIKLHNMLIGCSGLKNGSFTETDGVMGLGYSKHSFAVKVAEKFGNKFTYCLVDHLSPSNLANYLSFGDVTNSRLPNMKFTQLLLGYVNPFYALNVSGISVGGTMLEIPSEIWDITGDGGVILDSGTSLTILAQPAHLAVMDAFSVSALGKLDKVDLEVGPMKYCFEDKGYNESIVPKFGVHFADGEVLEPPVKSYVIDADEGVKCLGFVAADSPGTSIIGNVMQQNHMWEFDLAGHSLGFVPSSCTDFRKMKF